jgi:hypothetical protein
MRPGDKIIHIVPAAGYPSRVGWDGSPCGYAGEFVEFVYREERERRR